MALERPTKEGNSPVGENGFILLIIIPHFAGPRHRRWFLSTSTHEWVGGIREN